jgi:hypothetical protein
MVVLIRLSRGTRRQPAGNHKPGVAPGFASLCRREGYLQGGYIVCFCNCVSSGLGRPGGHGPRHAPRAAKRGTNGRPECMPYCNLTLQCDTHELHDRNGLRWPTRPKRSDHPRSRGVDLSDQWRFSVKPKTHPPFSAKRRPAKRPPNLADRGRTLAETAELSTFPAYWSVRLATQCQTRAVREKVRVGLRQYRYYIGKPFKLTVAYIH